MPGYVGCGTAPGPLIRSAHQSGPHRIHLYVGHQTVAPYVNGMFSAPVIHQIDARTVVPVGEKCLLPAVAALGYVMRIVGYNDSCDSGRGLGYRRSCLLGSRNKYGVP
jgi:hypothetical protein